MEKQCIECKRVYDGKRKQKFCSKDCRGLNDRKRNRVKVNCNNCSLLFEKTKSAFNRSKHHYCSADCRYEHMGSTIKGKDNPNWKGKTVPKTCTFCKETFAHKTYAEKGVYCSIECKAKDQMETLVGKNNPNYKQDKPNYKRIKERQYSGYKEWRMAVFQRDNFNCVKCGRNSTSKNRLAAHHIINHHSYPEGRTDVDNGVTLCFECHTNFHRKYGTIHNNEQQLSEFLQESAK